MSGEAEGPAYLRCSSCGRQNHIVNECRCDPNNLPTKAPTYRWDDNEYATQAECEDAIAEYLVNELENHSGVVTCGDKSYLIKINATLIE